MGMRVNSCARQNLIHSERGAELIEFALVIPLLLLIVLGIMVSATVSAVEVITNAAREGARRAILPDSSTADGEARINEYLDNVGLTNPMRSVSVVSTSLDDGSCGYLATITYPHEFGFITGILGYFSGTVPTNTITATSTMRLEASGGACP
jgi:Flp pilus assembly protein TadG